MRNKNLISILIVLLSITSRAVAYELWIGTSCTPKNAAVKTDTTIMYNARNISQAVKNKCSHPAIGDILLEAEPSKWYENADSRHELLKWLTSDPSTKNKCYVFQIMSLSRKSKGKRD